MPQPTAATVDKMRFYTVQKLGPKRSMTPEGFLLCEEVPVARTGEMLYGADEVPLEPDGRGVIRITRSAEELFSEATLASCEGKPITLGHPDEFVDPENFQSLSRGTMLNARRGTGIHDDFLFADLLITEKTAIKAVLAGIEEVSLGYNADYEQIQPGHGRQTTILINHNALVERGRCGPRCAIGDHEMSKKTGKRTFADRIRQAFMSKDAEEAENLAKEAEDSEEEGETKEEREEREAKEEKEAKAKDKKTADALNKILDAVTSLGERMDKIEEKVGDRTHDDDDDDEGDGTGDELQGSEKLDEAGVKLYTGDAAKRILPLAEILAPGIKLPTFDAKTTDAARANSLCKCQRRALDKAYQTEAGRAAIVPFLGSHKANFAKLPAAVVNAAFLGAGHLIRAQNNDAGSRSSVVSRTTDFGKPTTAADLNRQNKEFWANRSKH